MTPAAWNSGFVPYSEVSVRKKKLPGCFNTLPPGSSTSNGTALSGSDASDPASMITSNSASSGTPATTPSISSYCGLASCQVACMSPTAAVTSSRLSASSAA